jgi:sphinganine-1-phosphate aldolase
MARKDKPWITEPEVVAPVTIHPAIEKAAHYFGFTIKHVPVTHDFKADVAAMARAITSNTIALSASAPQYVHCVIDPIAEIGALALQHNLPLHVDACFGGFMLPFTESLGHATDPWDFRVPGVTSISADLHKYGYAPKGCSVVLYRNAHYRSFQFFAFSTWPGGLFCSPSICGTRPGPNIAAAWATLKVIGRAGYEDLTRKLMATAAEMMHGINAIEGLTVMGRPQMAAFAFTRCALFICAHCAVFFKPFAHASLCSKDPQISVISIADMMEKKGWKMERQTTTPPSIHCSVLPHHIGKAAELVRDIADCMRTYVKPFPQCTFVTHWAGTGPIPLRYLPVWPGSTVWWLRCPIRALSTSFSWSSSTRFSRRALAHSKPRGAPAHEPRHPAKSFAVLFFSTSKAERCYRLSPLRISSCIGPPGCVYLPKVLH